MNAIVIEHVPVAELPPQWRAKLAKEVGATVTVRIEEEIPQAAPAEELVTDDPAFGIWRDREDMADASAVHEAAQHDKWFRAEVSEAIKEADDPATVWVSNEEAKQSWAKQRAELLKRERGGV